MRTPPDPEPLWKTIAEGAKRLPPFLLFVVLLLLAFGGITLFDPQAIGDVRYWLVFGAFAILAELARTALSRLAERQKQASPPIPFEPAVDSPEIPPQPETNDEFTYDLFVSYHRFDQTWVSTTLLPYLDRHGLRVFVDFRDFRVGASRIKERERAVLSSRRTLLVLTPDYLESDWSELETILVHGLDPAARDRRVLPLILRPCPLPLRLHSLVALDLTHESQRPEALARLVRSLRADANNALPGNGTALLPAESMENLDEDVRQELNAFEIALTNNLPEGARQFLILQNRPEPAWRSPETFQAIEKIWERKAPEPLQRLVELWLQRHNLPALLEVVAQRGDEAVLTSLEWTLQHSLDEDWEQKASELIEALSRAGGLSPQRSGQLLDQNHQRAWKAILRRWRTITYWRMERSIPRNLQLGLNHLGLRVNPFGAERAEEDPLVLCGRYNDLPILTELDRSDSHLVFAPPGAGQTATALWLAHRVLQSYRAFPVYYPALAGLDLQSFASAMAEILLRYLAINPPAFLRCGIAGRTSLGRLLAQYVAPGDQLILRFHQAGLPLHGAGAELQRQILELTAGVESGPITDEDELLDVLYEAYPFGFQACWVLLDGSALAESNWHPAEKNPASRESFDRAFALAGQLNQVGLVTKIFWPEADHSLLPYDPGMPVGRIEWTSEHMKGLLHMRLAQAKEYSLDQWCDPRAGDLAPEERIIAASQNSPARLLYLGNLLLQRIGGKSALLSEADLDEIIGPLSSSS